MKLVLDSTACQAYGLCQQAAPDLVDLDDWGYAGLIGDGTLGEVRTGNLKRVVAGSFGIRGEDMRADHHDHPGRLREVVSRHRGQRPLRKSGSSSGARGRDGCRRDGGSGLVGLP